MILAQLIPPPGKRLPHTNGLSERRGFIHLWLKRPSKLQSLDDFA
jgi:hypothetical protein